MSSDYKIKHIVTPIERLLRYEHIPPRMIGDPQPEDEEWVSWTQREWAVYDAMMKKKRATPGE